MLGHRARTFRVADHHYALVSVRPSDPDARLRVLFAEPALEPRLP